MSRFLTWALHPALPPRSNPSIARPPPMDDPGHTPPAWIAGPTRGGPKREARWFQVRETAAMDSTGDGNEFGSPGQALLVRWDIGQNSRPSELLAAQTMVADVLGTVRLLVSVQREPPRYPGGVLLDRNGRQYLRRRSPYLRTIPPPVIAASGFSNPWWEILQESVAVQAAAGAGMSLTFLTVAHRILDAVKRVALFSDEVAHDRRDLQANAADAHPELVALIEADAVDVTGGTAPRVGLDRRQPGLRQPSVPADMPAHDAIIALAADRALDAMSALTDAIRRGGEFDTELLDATEAAQRIPIARQTQLALYEYARGAIELGELQARVGERDTREIPGTRDEESLTGDQPALGQVRPPRRPTAQLQPPQDPTPDED